MAGLHVCVHRLWSEYYDTLRKLLLPERDKAVEQNREALTQFAIHIVEAGYVP